MDSSVLLEIAFKVATIIISIFAGLILPIMFIIKKTLEDLKYDLKRTADTVNLAINKNNILSNDIDHIKIDQESIRDRLFRLEDKRISRNET